MVISDSDMEKEMSNIHLQIIIDFIIDEGIIMSILVNAMLSYMSLFHFDEANKCADFLLERYT